MNFKPVGIKAIAVSFPSIIRTNDYYRTYYPDLVAKAEEKTLARTFSVTQSNFDNKAADIWTEEMTPYLSDPFRGTVERRVFSPEESALSISDRAARDVLEAAKLGPEDIDLMLVATIFPDRVGPGDAAFLARKLGLQGAAWNLESTCSSALAALQTAAAMIRAGEYRNVLVVICTNYSRFTDKNDTLSFLSGDGAGAFVVSSLEGDRGILGTQIINTASTCGTFYNELTADETGNPQIFIRARKGAGKILAETAVPLVQECCQKAVKAAGVSLDEIDFFAFNTPTAWYTNVCTRALGIDRDRTLNLNPRYANIGPMLPVANLYHGAESGKIRENDLVLVYSIGSVSNAAASVMRWGKVALGPAPAPPITSAAQLDPSLETARV